MHTDVVAAKVRAGSAKGAIRESSDLHRDALVCLYRNAEPERFPGLTELMLCAGYPDGAIRGILGENLLRVARAVWK